MKLSVGSFHLTIPNGTDPQLLAQTLRIVKEWESIDGLCAIVEDQLHMDPRRSTLYLFCGKRCDRIKALLWESDGFVLLYKRMEVQGRFRLSRNQLEVKQLTWQQFDWLMSGLEIEQPKAFKPTQ